MELPLVSIIIVNFNGKDHIEKCLNSLNKILYEPIEIIVIDNNSSDDSVEFIKHNFPHVLIISLDTNYGFAEPNNICSKTAKGEFLLFLNNDTIVTPNFLMELVLEIKQNNKIAICQSLLLKPNGIIDSSGDFIDKIGMVYNSKQEINQTRRIFSPRAASMLIRKEIFSKLGGFDEKFVFSFEDVDLGWRSWILGYESIVVPKSIVYHVGGITTKKFRSESTFHGIKNQLSMKITNFELPLVFKNLFLFFIIYGTREIKIWFDYKINGKTMVTSTKFEDTIAQKPDFGTAIKSVFWLFSNMGYLISKHKDVNSKRVLSTKELEKMNLISNIRQ
ncbi:MAG: glycosyltransferase family 2 protein [Nanoarchaeota archaeon]